MARAPRAEKAEEPTPDVAIVTDGNADATEEAPEATAQDGDDSEADGAVQVDGGGRTLVEVASDGVIVRVGGRPLMLSRGQRLRVSASVAERPSFRRL